MFYHRLITVFPLTLKIGMAIVFVPVASMNIASKTISITTNGFFVFRNNMNMSVKNILPRFFTRIRIDMKTYYLGVFFEFFNNFSQKWNYSFFSNFFLHARSEVVTMFE